MKNLVRFLLILTLTAAAHAFAEGSKEVDHENRKPTVAAVRGECDYCMSGMPDRVHFEQTNVEKKDNYTREIGGDITPADANTPPKTGQ